MKDIEALHPELIVLCHQFLQKCKEAGLEVRVTQSFRTKAEQTEIYNKGRTAASKAKGEKIVTKCKYPDSPHCWGCAFDIVVIVDGKANWARTDLYKKAGQIGKSLGLQWGGDFKSFVDMPHFELPKYVKNKSCNWLKATYKTPDAFKKTWKAEEKSEEEDDVKVVDIIFEGTTIKGFMYEDKVYLPVRELEDFQYTVEWKDGKAIVNKKG